MKHTPGPWEAACLHAAYRQGEEWSEHENLQWEVYGPREPSGIGDFYKADARLIAAAPNMLEALKVLETYASSQICTHDDTHRGGTIWEICDQCGAKWADDKGGKPKFKWPKEIESARAAIAKAEGA